MVRVGVSRAAAINVCGLFKRNSPSLCWLSLVRNHSTGRLCRALGQLVSGDTLNQPISGVAWPSSLQQLSFDMFFNQPIVGVVWPAFLQHVSGKASTSPQSGSCGRCSFSTGILGSTLSMTSLWNVLCLLLLVESTWHTFQWRFDTVHSCFNTSW